MNIEYIFRQIPEFQYFKLDMILFESNYPVMFTGINDKDELYLFICCLVNSKEAKWIGTKTTYENLIALLENRITIRDSYLNISNSKLLITYDGIHPTCGHLDYANIPTAYLPTYGEFMDAEDGEFSEELRIMHQRINYREFKVSLRQKTWSRFAIKSSDYTFKYKKELLSSTSDLEETIFHPMRTIHNSSMAVHS